MLRYLVTNIGLYINGGANKVSFTKAFTPRLVRCARDITGIWLPGIGRRPLWNSFREVEKLIAANLHVASGVTGTTRPSENPDIKVAWRTFGIDTILKIPKGVVPVRWTAPALLTFTASLHNFMAAKTTQVICFFGHSITGKHATQSLVPRLRGAPLGAPLCKP